MQWKLRMNKLLFLLASRKVCLLAACWCVCVCVRACVGVVSAVCVCFHRFQQQQPLNALLLLPLNLFDACVDATRSLSNWQLFSVFPSLFFSSANAPRTRPTLSRTIEREREIWERGRLEMEMEKQQQEARESEAFASWKLGKRTWRLFIFVAGKNSTAYF